MAKSLQFSYWASSPRYVELSCFVASGAPDFLNFAILQSIEANRGKCAALAMKEAPSCLQKGGVSVVAHVLASLSCCTECSSSWEKHLN